MRSGSAYAFCYGCTAVALAVGAGDTAMSDDGIALAIDIVVLPSMVFGVMMLAEYWVQCLPSQVLCPGSFARKLRNVSDNTSAFVLAGCISGGTIAVMGTLPLFLDISSRKKIDLVLMLVSGVNVGVVLFVALQTARAIDKALIEASESSRVFYMKARKKLRRQAATVCGVIAFGIGVLSVKALSVVAANTRIIFVAIQILLGDAITVIFCQSTKCFSAKIKSGFPVLGAHSTRSGVSPRTGVRNDDTLRAHKADPARVVPI